MRDARRNTVYQEEEALLLLTDGIRLQALGCRIKSGMTALRRAAASLSLMLQKSAGPPQAF
ncbi:hypothetical protein ACFPOE_20960 [Caenimonas terrae]|uniref:Uncharacterized protein n=1 Tax=Caenimonas terrae TaxID=696074 RepID=A0ABW0NHH4_9BURK